MKIFRVLLISLIIISPAIAEKYAGEFLYLGVGARALALGSAYIASDGDAFSGYYNPAGLTNIHDYQAAFMHSETFGSLLNHDYLTVARKYGESAAAVSLYYLGGGGILITEQYQGIYRVKEEKSHADYVLGFSYARNQNDRIEWGLTTKIIYRKIVDVSAWGIGLDAGMKYHYRDNITAGVVIQDLTGTVLSYSYDNKETVNPTLKLGLDLNHQLSNFKGTVLTDVDIRFEGRQASAQFYQSWISADTHLGFELSFKDVIAARVGSDIGNLTTGVGLKFSRYTIDIALNDHPDLDTSYRGSLIVEW